MTTALPPPNRFSRKMFADEAHLVGARWWHDTLQPTAQHLLTRRQALTAMVAIAGPALMGGLFAWALHRPEEVDISMDALDLQRREGWNVGHSGAALQFPAASPVDVDGGTSWRGAMTTLAADLAPAQASLAPFYVRTLLQSPAEPGNGSLRAALQPVAPPTDDVRRGEAIRDLFEQAKLPRDIAVILDLDGPSSMAVAAGMARAFEPVFVLDNWPHPLGVVPSHLTLGTALYFRPLFVRLRAERRAGAPPVFVLDRNRLAHYKDDGDRFDNRYVARLPTAVNFEALGIKRILYVTPDQSHLVELDDLNEDFVDYHRASIDVRAMAVTDLRQESSQHAAYYYGGHPHTHLWFWHTYGWHTARLPAPAERIAPPLQVSNGAAYRPAPRPTIFSSRVVGGGRGIGRQKPSGFGRVSVRAAKATGAISEVHVGRSGSFGRAGGWGGG